MKQNIKLSKIELKESTTFKELKREVEIFKGLHLNPIRILNKFVSTKKKYNEDKRNLIKFIELNNYFNFIHVEEYFILHELLQNYINEIERFLK